MRSSGYQALTAAARARLVAVAARAAFLASGRASQWERDAYTREYWARCLQDVFDEHGFNAEVEVLARAAFERFGYVANWQSSPKAQQAWIRRMGIALEAISHARSREAGGAAPQVGWGAPQ